MQEEKTNPSPTAPNATSSKPLVTQVMEAMIDGAADIAKSWAMVARAGRQFGKSEVGNDAVAIVRMPEELPPNPTTKIAAAKRAVKRAPSKKSPRVASKSFAKKAPAKAKRAASKKSKARKRTRSR